MTRATITTLLLIGAVWLTLGSVHDPIQQRGALVASVALVLWLTESIPLYATTILLIGGIALALSPLDPTTFSLWKVLGWSAHPVMALFFGGFCLSIAGAKHGIDSWIAAWMLRLSGGSRPRLLLLIMIGTAILSMWMSNIAAAAMMIATLRPLFASPANDRSFRTALLVGIAFAADFGGIGTPIGTGPNLVAIGAIESRYRITFGQWMMFGLPLCAVMVSLSYLLLRSMHHVRGTMDVLQLKPRPMTRASHAVVGLFVVTIGLWLTEPLHGVSSGVIALLLAGVLFAARLLTTADLAKLEWETLMLVAGGLTLGELLSATGLAHTLAGVVNWAALPLPLLLLGFIGASALLSAVASNTAAAAMLIQIGMSIHPTPAFAVLVALGASMGVPFVISTPPNAMSFGQGGLRTRDLAVPGLILMSVGCVIIALLGPPVLSRLGIP